MIAQQKGERFKTAPLSNFGIDSILPLNKHGHHCFVVGIAILREKGTHCQGCNDLL